MKTKIHLLLCLLMVKIMNPISVFAQNSWKKYLNMTTENWKPIQGIYYEFSPVFSGGGRFHVDGEMGSVKIWELHENNGKLGTVFINLILMFKAEAKAQAQAEKYGVGFVRYELVEDRSGEADFRIITGAVNGFDFTTYGHLTKLGPGTVKLGLKTALAHGYFEPDDTTLANAEGEADFFYAFFGLPLRYKIYYNKNLVFGADWEVNFLSVAGFQIKEPGISLGSPVRIWAKYSIIDRCCVKAGFENGKTLGFMPGIFFQTAVRF